MRKKNIKNYLAEISHIHCEQLSNKLHIKKKKNTKNYKIKLEKQKQKWRVIFPISFSCTLV